jgi:hypothetical protein
MCAQYAKKSTAFLNEQLPKINYAIEQYNNIPQKTLLRVENETKTIIELSDTLNLIHIRQNLQTITYICDNLNNDLSFYLFKKFGSSYKTMQYQITLIDKILPKLNELKTCSKLDEAGPEDLFWKLITCNQDSQDINNNLIELSTMSKNHNTYLSTIVDWLI